ncbi:MAG: hypothetical protein QM784_35325 [Polyangiaceae bacterium]
MTCTRNALTCTFAKISKKPIRADTLRIDATHVVDAVRIARAPLVRALRLSGLGWSTVSAIRRVKVAEPGNLIFR